MNSEIRNIEEALDTYVKDGMNGAFVTGWILVASVSSPSHDIGDSDGYVTVTSDGLPHHAQVGLLQVAQNDKQSMSVLASLGAMLNDIYGNDEDDE